MGSASRRLAAAAVTLLPALVAVPATQAASPDVVHKQTIHLETETLETFCGETATFDESGKILFMFVGMSEDVFTWTSAIRGTYTVTFDDPSLGVWRGSFTEYEAVHATACGTFTFSFISNERQGSGRVHVTTTFVVSPDATIRVQNQTFDVTGCPST